MFSIFTSSVPSLVFFLSFERFGKFFSYLIFFQRWCLYWCKFFLVYMKWKQTLACFISEGVAHFTGFPNSMLRVDVAVGNFFCAYSYFISLLCLCVWRISELIKMQLLHATTVLWDDNNTNSFRASIIVICRQVIMFRSQQGFGLSTNVTQADLLNR